MPRNKSLHNTKSDSRFTGISFWMLVMSFALFFSPKSYAVPSSIFYAWRLSQSIVSAIAVLLYLRRDKISLRWTMFMLFLFTYYLLSTFIKNSGGSYRAAVYQFASVGGFVTLLEYGLRRDRDTCLDALLTAGILMCGVHFYTFLRYRRLPLGMRSTSLDLVGELTRHPWFFLTHDNGSAFYFIPMIGGLWYRAMSRQKGMLEALLFSVLTLYMYWSLNTVTAKYATTFLVLSLFYVAKFGVSGPFSKSSYRTALLIGVSLCIIVISFYANEVFTQLASSLGKSSDMGRGRIWQRVWPLFWNSPLIGSGFEEDSTIIFKLGINHCHNIIVQILYTGGITAMILSAASLLQCDVAPNTRKKQPIAAQVALQLTIIALFVCATFDWYLYMPIQFLPFFLYHYTDSLDAEICAEF